MPHNFQPLANLLQSTFKLNLSRIKCLVLLIEGLISTRTVNLAVLATSLSGYAKIGSNYKRLQRFMRQIAFDWAPLAQLLAALSGILGEAKWTLILDRTNWRLGKVDVNILYLSVAYKNIAVPLFGIFWKIKNAAILTILIALT
jgi:hypothetical protein